MDESKHNWLVRESNNMIRGPYTSVQMLDLLHSGKLKPRTEISRGNSYWFHIEETAELEHFFPQDFQEKEASSDPTIALADVTSTGLSRKENQLHISSMHTDGASTNSNLASDEKIESVQTDFRSPERKKADTARLSVDRSDFADISDEPTLIPEADTRSLNNIEFNEEQNSLQKRKLLIGGALVVVLALFIVVFSSDKQETSQEADQEDAQASQQENVAGKSIKELFFNVKTALLIRNLNLAQGSLTALESKVRANPLIPLSNAIVKSQFLYDRATARSLLAAAYSFAEKKTDIRAEVLNITGIYSLDSDLDESVKSFEQALKLSSGNPYYSYNLAMTLMKVGQKQKATKILRELDTKGDQVLERERLISLGMSLPFLASRQFQKAQKIDPYDSRISLMLAVESLNRNDTEDTIRKLDQYIDKGIEITLPSRVESFRIISYPDIYLSANKVVQTYLLKKTKMSKNLESKLIASSAILSVINGKYNEAEKIIERGLKDFAGNEDLLKAIAYLRYQQNQYEDIVGLLKSSEEAFSSSFAIQSILALAYLKLNDLQAAKAPLARLARQHGDDPRTHAWMGLYAEQVRGLGEAKKMYEKALAMDPYNITALQGAYRAGSMQQFSKSVYSSIVPSFK